MLTSFRVCLPATSQYKQTVRKNCRCRGRHLAAGSLAAGRWCCAVHAPLRVLEFLSVYLGDQYEISALYDPPNMSALEDSMTKTRERQGATMHPTTGSGLRGLMRGLKSGDLVVVLPDQVPQEKKFYRCALFWSASSNHAAR